nr:MAG TPA: hypothetical protein [Caudoviricetes sp.]
MSWLVSLLGLRILRRWLRRCRKSFSVTSPPARLLWWRRGRVLMGLSWCVWPWGLRLTLLVLRLRSAPIGLRVLLCLCRIWSGVFFRSRPGGLCI